MAEMSIDERCKIASELVEQSPPGEVNDVINDLRAIIADDEALMPHVRNALREYNLAQLTVVEHDGGSSLLSPATLVPGEEDRHVFGDKSFKFDHITLAVSDYEPYELPEEEQTFRSELAASLAAYTKNHFAGGVSAVSCSQYPLLPPQPEPEVKPEPTAEPVSDVVDEQVAAGDNEPAPTPAVGETEVPSQEVVSPGGIELVDEKVEGVKAEQAGEETKVTEDAGETEVVEGGEEAKDVAGESAEPHDSQEVRQEDAEGQEVPQEVPDVREVSGSQEVAGDQEVQTKADDAAPSSALSDLPAEPPVEEVEPSGPTRKQQRVDNPTYTLEVVGNRYKPSNFWTGRWRTRWVVDQAEGKVSGTINVDVHYYEQGNVQLATCHTASFPCPAQANGSQSVASQIVTAISKLETNYQLELNDVYDDLGDKAFRALRRALPVTRQKMDWDKVGGYTLGSDLKRG